MNSKELVILKYRPSGCLKKTKESFAANSSDTKYEAVTANQLPI